MMLIPTPKRGAAAIILASALGVAMAQSEPTAVKRELKLPPSADLSYSLKVSQRGLSMSGEALVQWRAGDGMYSIASEAKAPLFGKILENRSEGTVDDFGLAPAQYVEKRYHKEPTTTSFKRDAKRIGFSESDETYPIKGGEQDRTSAPWQLLAIARAAPDQFKPGSEWPLFVAGRRDAEAWSFKVLKQESVQTGQGAVNALHVVREPAGHKASQQVDLWLAPSLDWYPVKLRYAESDGDFVEQTLEKVSKK